MFNNMHDAYTILWNAMMGEYLIHGYSKDSLKLFNPHDVDIVS